tara:strand:+ start:1201 stop:1806 length:606 start_codon:yes stop_codon:yes gene_type:complete
MGEFGWAYVQGGALTGALGPTGSVLLKTGDKEISGSTRLMFDTSSYALSVSGSLYTSGAITASYLYLPDLIGATAVSSKFLALDSNDNLVLTSSVGTGSGGGGGISYSRRAVTSTITASTSDTILGVSAASALEIRLPTAGSYSSGQYFTIKDEAGNSNIYNITVLTTGVETIDGHISITLESPYSAINIYSDGTSKFFIY